MALSNQGLEGYSRDPGFDQNTVRESGKRHKCLVGIRDLTAPREAGFAKICVWDGGFFRLLVENSGNRHDPNKRPILAAKAAGVSFQTKL